MLVWGVEGIWNETKLELNKTHPVAVVPERSEGGFSSEGDQKQMKGFHQGSGMIKAPF